MKISKGALTVGFGQAFVQGGSLSKNIFLASVLGVEEYAIAAIYMLTAAVFEMIQDVSIGKYILTCRYHLGQRTIGLLFGFSLLKGIFITALSIVMFLIVFKLSSNIRPEAAWLCVIPLFLSGMNLTPNRYQRQRNHARVYWVEILAQAISIGVAVGSYSLVENQYLALLVIMSLYTSKFFLSWLLAKPCKLQYPSLSDIKGKLNPFLKFAIPMWINGLVILLSIQGERGLVSGFYEKEIIAIYSVGFSISFGVYGFISKSGLQILLPILRNTTSKQFITSKLEIYAGIFVCFGSLFFMIFSELILGFINKDLLEYLDIFVIAIFTNLVKIQKIPYTAMITSEGASKELMKINLLKVVYILIVAPLFIFGLNVMYLLVFSILSELATTLYARNRMMLLGCKSNISSVIITFSVILLMTFISTKMLQSNYSF